MTWAAPKVNWIPNDGILDSDFNRIEGNIAHLRNSSFSLSSCANSINVSFVSPQIPLQSMIIPLLPQQQLRLARHNISHSALLTVNNPDNLNFSAILRVYDVVALAAVEPAIYNETIPIILSYADVPITTNIGSTDRYCLIQLWLNEITGNMTADYMMSWASWSVRFEIQ